MVVSETHKFEVGDKVRILDVASIAGARPYWKNGDVVSVSTIAYGGRPRLSQFTDDKIGLVIGFSEYHAIEPVSKKPKKAERIAQLEKQVVELNEKVAKLERNEAEEAPKIPQLTPNQKRKAIIAEAKVFVDREIEARRSLFGYIEVSDSRQNYSPWSCSRIIFKVDAEKRTVVALAIGSSSGKVVEKAVAKCSDGDVFNADIGKTIAVAKLFGLDFERFANAVQPSEIAVGMVVRDKVFSTLYTVRKINSDITERKHGTAFNVVECSGWLGEKQVTITDDTDAQYVD